MSLAVNANEINTLSSVMLSTLDEAVFFGKLSGFFHQALEEHKVLIFKVYQDGATQLVADSGQALDNQPIHEKGEGLAAYVTRIKRAYYSNNVQRDPLFSGLQIPSEVTSELCVPVVSQGMILCTINIQSTDEDRKFGEEDILKVQSVLDQLKSPISNMRLYLLAKHLNRELLKKLALKDKELSERGTVSTASSGREDIKVVGLSKLMTGVNELISKVSKEDYPVLFEGESGTGKKLLAKKLHSLSSRSGAPCNIVHCNSENDEQLEAEIFGRENEAGVLEQSNGGTIIFKEISELSENLQNKLLRALTCGKIRRINGEKNININVRVVSTSRVDLSEQVELGNFREDLFYRLNTIKIKVPTLRERFEDMKVLASHFLNSNRDEEEKKMITDAAVESLCSYDWPGNIQELKSIMERTYVLTEGKYIEQSDLPELVSNEPVEEVKVEIFEEQSLFELEKAHIIKTLDHLSGNKTKAAKSLGITVKTLYNKLHNYGLVVGRAQ